MAGYSGHKAASQYRKLGLSVEIESASPHRLIQLLFEGALERVQQAQGAMQRQDVALAGTSISRAIDVIVGLRQSLDDDAGDLTVQLDSLYQYCEDRLFQATRQQNPEILAEVSRLLTTLKSGWDGIASEVKA
ncbi:flagellar export chaperone FliS [Gilvimarinus sp. SDUM040013]|uniref:Flagellar secretion chaperone FliS n=1 Tax=Gilvimarinus gilvus TaxID=3058038 RepID=A0ABU4RU76_9GAMM|nr:flagellar export chaperone FliS [Gilvimarinus sp. SDUM040013]MDO3385067.1 flagellar export chaperone FliS [Gilvimarinus sp. SDUM040013]MDX6848442.1 flagellar export chaperone FliS [Gilvimarinus sp. SDUM040013]